MAIVLQDNYDLGESISKDPLIVVADDFVTPLECQHIIKQAAGKLKRGKVTMTDEVAYSDARTGRTAWIPHDKTPIIQGLVKRLSDLVGIPVYHAESLQVVYYSETQEYRPHFDAWELDTERGRNRTANGGQRMVTALMYLNNVDAGGSTEFPKLKIEVEPIAGRLVLFHNTELKKGRNELHKKSLHGGMPVHYGEKWACNLWFRAEPYERPDRLKSRNPGSVSSKARGSKKSRKSQKAARRRNR